MAAHSPFYNSLEPRYITAGKAADIIGVTKRCVYDMLNDGRLTRHTLGTRILRIDQNEIEAVMGKYDPNAMARTNGRD
jgi:excisionase family DNA binding protein